MIKKLGNKGLLLILVLLVAAFAVFRYISNKKGENTFQTNIVPKLDTNKLNNIVIFPQMKAEKPYILSRRGDWYASQGDVTSRAEPRAAHYLISQLQQITPDRLGTTDPKDWISYGVNYALGTRVVLLNDKDTALDVVVGRFSYMPAQRQAISYLRLWGHNEVYAIDGFLAMNITENFDAWRDKKIMPGEYTSWNKLTFTYPHDSGFVIMNDKTDRWVFGDARPDDLVGRGKKPDSLTAVTIIKDINNQNYGSFINKFDTTGKQALFTLKVEGSGFNPVVIKAYPADSINKYAITSTLNPGVFFSGSRNGMFGKIFPGKYSFYKKEEKAGKK